MRADGLRILYVGSSGVGGNGLDKRAALQSLGAELVDFDTLPYQQAGSRLARSLADRMQRGASVDRLNRDLLALASEQAGAARRRVTHVWVDKGVWLWPSTLESLRDGLGAALIHYANDAQLVSNRSRHFRACIPLYDLLFTTKRFELDGYRALGARSVHLVFDGVSENRFLPRVPTGEQRARYGSDLTFIGRCESHYSRTLLQASRCGLDLRIWGPRWPRYARRHPWAAGVVRGEGVWKQDYPVALAAARICLGLLSKQFPETVTTRSFEIPACASMLLAERSDDHQSLYQEGVEAEFFSSVEEMADKLRFYVSHEERRSQLARRGRERFERSGYTREGRYAEMIEIVRRELRT